MTAHPSFSYVAGTGGIGKGVLFLLEGEHDLGRNESRLGKLMDFEDYCKLHIILHYTAVLSEGSLPVFALGRVGADANGETLKKQMQAAGISTELVQEDDTAATMYAVCFQYPNGDGGNVTTSNSACSLVSAEDMADFFVMNNRAGRGLILAAPEVPMSARLELLKQGKSRGCYNVASFLPSEAKEFLESGGLLLTDLLSVNRDEAQAVLKEAGIFAYTDLALTCAEYLFQNNPELSIIITDGGNGSLCLSKVSVNKITAIAGDVVNTAGAGDCLIGTVMAAMACGVPLQAPHRPGLISSAAELGSLAAGLKVQDKNTIHWGINKHSLADFARARGYRFSDEIQTLFFRDKFDF